MRLNYDFYDSDNKSLDWNWVNVGDRMSIGNGVRAYWIGSKDLDHELHLLSQQLWTNARVF
jgi:hypothetical protein